VGFWEKTAVCLVLGSCVACGRSYGPGRTPTETIRSLEGALRARDYSACYDLLASDARTQFDQSIRAAQSACGSLPPEIKDRLDLDDFCESSPRDALQEAADRAHDNDPNLDERLQSFQLAVLGVEEYGNQATARVSVMWKNIHSETTIELVRQKTRWFLANQSGIETIPLPRAPTISCTTFT